MKRLHRNIICILVIVILFSLNTSKILKYINTINLSFVGNLYSSLTLPFHIMNKASKNIVWGFAIQYCHDQFMEVIATKEEQHLSYRALELENKQLKNALKFVQGQKSSLISTRIVHLESDLGNMLIKAGSNHGVQEGNAVINTDGLVGRVVNVTPNFSRVMTVGNPNLYIPAVFSQANQHCIAGGVSHYSGNIPLTYLKNPHFINIGDILLTSGSGQKIPFGITLGKAVLINNKIMFESSINRNNLNIVQVLISK